MYASILLLLLGVIGLKEGNLSAAKELTEPGHSLRLTGSNVPSVIAAIGNVPVWLQFDEKGFAIYSCPGTKCIADEDYMLAYGFYQRRNASPNSSEISYRFKGSLKDGSSRLYDIVSLPDNRARRGRMIQITNHLGEVLQFRDPAYVQIPQQVELLSVTPPPESLPSYVEKREGGVEYSDDPPSSKVLFAKDGIYYDLVGSSSKSFLDLSPVHFVVEKGLLTLFSGSTWDHSRTVATGKLDKMMTFPGDRDAVSYRFRGAYADKPGEMIEWHLFSTYRHTVTGAIDKITIVDSKGVKLEFAENRPASDPTPELIVSQSPETPGQIVPWANADANRIHWPEPPHVETPEEKALKRARFDAESRASLIKFCAVLGAIFLFSMISARIHKAWFSTLSPEEQEAYLEKQRIAAQYESGSSPSSPSSHGSKVAEDLTEKQRNDIHGSYM